MSFFQRQKDIFKTSEHLLKCLNSECLLRDEYEVILRILLIEAKARNLDIRHYLTLICDYYAPSELIEIPVDVNDLQDID